MARSGAEHGPVRWNKNPAIRKPLRSGLPRAVSTAATLAVGQHGLVFTRSSASLLSGDRIVVTNEDDVIHNIHIFGPGDDDSIDLGLQKPGATLTYRFDKPGAYRVRCNIHPSVKMAVTVKWPTAR
jgi:plastocyanin